MNDEFNGDGEASKNVGSRRIHKGCAITWQKSLNMEAKKTFKDSQLLNLN